MTRWDPARHRPRDPKAPRQYDLDDPRRYIGEMPKNPRRGAPGATVLVWCKGFGGHLCVGPLDDEERCPAHPSSKEQGKRGDLVKPWRDPLWDDKQSGGGGRRRKVKRGASRRRKS